jgi:hypothetical protein
MISHKTVEVVRILGPRGVSLGWPSSFYFWRRPNPVKYVEIGKQIWQEA